jgi:murein DD-endopeptidase MepM/ murein hydrolase activator NlpD
LKRRSIKERLSIKELVLDLAKLSLAVFVLVFIFKAGGAESSSIDQKRQELDQIQSQIDYYQNLAARKMTQINSLSAQIEKMEAEIKVTELNIQKTQKKIAITESEIVETKANIKQKEAELAYQKSVLNEALRVIYEEGNVGFLESFLKAGTLSDLIDRSEYLDTVENKIEITMAKIEEIKADLLAKKKDLDAKNADLHDDLAELNASRAVLADQRGIKGNLLVKTRGEQSIYNQQVASAKRAWENANTELKAMEEAAKGGDNAPSASGFYWPLNGWISAGYGYSNDYWAGVFHSGIDIVAPGGTSVRASKDGTVIAVQDGYGNTYPYSYIYGNYVKIDHGGGFITVYGHLLRGHLRVHIGSHVSGGSTVIGFEDNSGFSTGNHLHFEVRYNGTPTNPMRYLP